MIATSGYMTDIRTTKAAKMLGVTVRTVARWIDAGYFPGAKRLNPYIEQSPWVIPEEEIKKFIEARDKPPRKD